MESHFARIEGMASLTGTERYVDRFPELHPSHFRLCNSLMLSSIGIGTYLGAATDHDDERYTQAIVKAVASGCNVIDTAINYRFQRSERCVGRALRQLVHAGFDREELVLCSKAGFIPFDGSYPVDPYEWIETHLVETGIVTPDEIHPSGHCMAPMYLLRQLDRSLDNMGVSSLDVYYIHNPETQLSELNEVRFYEALELAFRAMETAVREGKIAMYGIATWDGFLETRQSGRLLKLERVIEAARRAGGERHCFRMIELPVNLAMAEAITLPNQDVGDEQMTFLEAARAFNIGVVASASLMQGQLTRNLPLTLQQAIPELPTDAARALQFVRSTPGVSTALVGMKSPEHVAQNMDLATLPVMGDEEFQILFGER